MVENLIQARALGMMLEMMDMKDTKVVCTLGCKGHCKYSNLRSKEPVTATTCVVPKREVGRGGAE